MNVFDFTESMVGPYKEAVMAVIVAPLVKPGERLPKSAFYPYLVATTTKAAREHAIERWHLPHWMSDVEIDFEPGPDRTTARVRADGAPVADLTITEHSWSPVSHLYQSFMQDGDQTYLAHITMEGKQSEHEDEKGAIKLYDHPFNQPLVDLRGLRDPVPRALDARRDADLRAAGRARDRLIGRAGRRPLRRLQPAVRQGQGSPAGRPRAAGAWAATSPTASPRRAGDEARLTAEALGRGFRRIVAVGGDGTWSNVGNAIIRSGVDAALGLVPAGTGCDLAKSLGVPARDVAGCARIARDGHSRRIDVGPHRGPLLPQRGRLRLRHRGHRGLAGRCATSAATSSTCTARSASSTASRASRCRMARGRRGARRAGRC